MRIEDARSKLEHRARGSSRAKDAMMKIAALVAGGVALVSALVLSLAFFAVAAVVLIVIGGYVWWRTRDLRRQLRAHMQAEMQAREHSLNPREDIIEGVVIRRTESPEDRRTLK